MTEYMRVWPLSVLLFGALVGCEVKNPIAENQGKLEAVAQVPARDEVAPTEGAPVELKAPIADKLPMFKRDAQGKIELDPAMRRQLQERAAAAQRQRDAVAADEAGGAEAGGAAPPAEPDPIQVIKAAAPERTLTSKDFTTLSPDAADTASRAPVAKDLKRYTKDLKGKGKLRATIHTTMGEFSCELYEKQSPITVANFVGLARGLKAWTDPANKEVLVGVPLYQSVPFHRVIPNFMIQGGDPLGMGSGGPGYQIPDEFDKSLRHDTGAILSMANAGANTGGSQFFITEVPTPHLDDRHTVFGKCDKPELVKEIASVPRDARDRPREAVLIEKIVISRDKK